MITPEELRIGNYYNSTKFGTPVKCEMADLCEIYQRAEGATPDETHVAEIFELIPLTEDWLIKFNFKIEIDLEEGKIFINKDSNWKFILQFYEFTSNNEGAYYLIEYLGQLEVKIEHVHHLQNLYSVLTGKELTINETIKA